jgi:hypothetical protein
LNSRTTERFRQLCSKLPENIQHQAKIAYALFRENPHHGSLQFKKIRGSLHSIRIGAKYRALGTLQGDTITWFWIGPHAEYDQLLKHL